MQNENKETANELAALNEKMDKLLTYVSSINYLLMYGNKIDKDEHYDHVKQMLVNPSKAELHQ